MSDIEQVMYGPLYMGDTRTVLGIYKILAVLRLLAVWADTDYRLWFNKAVLGLGP